MWCSKPSTHVLPVRGAQSELFSSYCRNFLFPLHLCVFSNLTFGTGGKNKEGKAVAGWGYYEVRGDLYLFILDFLKSDYL